MPTSSTSSNLIPLKNSPRQVCNIAPKTRYAKFSRPFVHAGVIHSVRRGTREQPLHVEYRVNNLLHRFVAPELPGVDDLRVLCALIALASAKHVGSPELLPEAANRQDADKVSMLLQHTVSLSTSYAEIAREAGYAAGSGSASHIRESLMRWYATSVFVENLGIANSLGAKGHPILKELEARDQGNNVELKICPLLSAAILGGDGEYLRLDMLEFRRLTTDVGRLLYLRLHWINPGKFGKIGMDVLMSYAYNGDPSTSNALKKRRQAVREGLKDLRTNVNWTAVDVDGMYHIGRPPPPFKQAPAKSSANS